MEDFFTLLFLFICIIFIIWFGLLQFDAIERDARRLERENRRKGVRK
tara:strand:- start:356 stop:496 length:141 start_codon:yes stop_codon:yes gene_type:complete